MAKIIIGLVLLFAFKAFSADELQVKEVNNTVSASTELSTKQLENIKKSIQKALSKLNESV
ncbi:MAG: hypothetical protein VYA54_06860 [Bdellovibrionota bacterium]|nr:hypothetical protein [Bdellovibrionota bacterium]